MQQHPHLAALPSCSLAALPNSLETFIFLMAFLVLRAVSNPLVILTYGHKSAKTVKVNKSDVFLCYYSKNY